MAKYWWYTFILAKELFTLYISLMLSAIIFCLMCQTHLHVFLLVIILIMAVFYIGFLRDVPSERINKYFVAKKLPFSNDRVIFQWVKSPRSENVDCKRECHKTCETFNEKKDFFYLEFTVPSKN